MNGSISSYAMYVAVIAVVLAFSLSTAPECAEPFQNMSYKDDTKNIVEYIGGDGKTTLRGHWYYAADQGQDQGPSPVIVMAHGLGLTQSQGLEDYITAFQKGGMNVFTFDYATFGQSDGMPRHNVCPKSHVADLRSTVEMIQGLDTDTDTDIVDQTRIGLWGTSLGGGHVVQLASEFASESDTTSSSSPSVQAIVSQVPHLEIGFKSLVIPSVQITPLDAMKGLGYFCVALIRWTVNTMVLNKPGYYPLVGLPGNAGMMQNPGDYEGYLRLAQSDDTQTSTTSSGWTNAAITIGGLKIVFQYGPLSSVDSIVDTPTLLIAAEHDTLCPASFVKEAHSRIPKSEYYEVKDAGHFDIYSGKELEETLAKEAQFFQKHLGVIN